MNMNEQVIIKAYADLVAEVFLRLRNGHFAADEQLRDLGDALHNISGILGEYGTWIDDAGYRRLYLRRYDSRWADKGLALEKFFDERMQFQSSPRSA